MHQVRKHRVQGVEAIDLTVGDHFKYLAARIDAFPEAIFFSVAFFEHQNEGVNVFVDKNNIVNPDNNNLSHN